MPLRDPHSYADVAQGRIRHIDFEFDIDFASKTIRGKAKYLLDKAQAGSLFFDVREVQIESVQAEGEPLAFRVDQSDPVLGQRLHIDNAKGAERIEISFVTSPTASALGWLEPPQTAGGTHPFVFSQCQALHARSIFPCQDSPSVRFTYRAKVRVKAPLRAAMAAKATGECKVGELLECSFEMPQPIPSYLFGLAAGNLEFQPLGPRSGVYAEPETLKAAVWEFSGTEAMIDEAEKLFGPYLWEQFNVLVMPPSFPYGGMENPRLTFLTPSLIVGDRSMVNVLVHELAHSWTGNLVTNATWEDFWLNEGWTVYAERRILERLEGDAYAQLQGAVRREGMLEDMRLFGMQSKETCLKFSQKGIDPDEVFSTIPYEKGCSFLTRIELAVGRKRFDPFIRKYIERFQFQSATTEEFLDFLRQELPEIQGTIDVQTWVYAPGFPEDAPVPVSPLLDDVNQKLSAFKAGQRFEKDQVAAWKPQQIEIFLKNLPRPVTLSDCQWLSDLFGLKGSHNRNNLAEYYVLAIASGEQQVLPEVERFLGSIGRMLYLKPLYRALIEAPWSRDKARPIFERFRQSYHPIAAGVIERLLTQASL